MFSVRTAENRFDNLRLPAWLRRLVVGLSPQRLLRWQVNRAPIYGAHSVTDRCLSPARIIPPLLHAHLHLNTAVTRRTNGRRLGTVNKKKNSSAVSDVEETRGTQIPQLLSSTGLSVHLAGCPHHDGSRVRRNIARCGCSCELWGRS